jgi:NADPH:quinone reductase-like Zn-dependent oxidoreductase
MKAICLSTEYRTILKEVTTPKRAESNHLIIKMEACGINPGDLVFIGGALRGISKQKLEKHFS